MNNYCKYYSPPPPQAMVSEDPLPTVDFIGGKSSSMGKRSKDKDKDKEKAGQAKAGGKQSARQ